MGLGRDGRWLLSQEICKVGRQDLVRHFDQERGRHVLDETRRDADQARGSLGRLWEEAAGVDDVVVEVRFQLGFDLRGQLRRDEVLDNDPAVTGDDLDHSIRGRRRVFGAQFDQLGLLLSQCAVDELVRGDAFWK